MKYGKKIATILLVLGSLVILLGSNGVLIASAAVIYVPDDYAKIQWAVDNATAGSTIIVRDGTYIENVNIDKDNLTIKSENGSANCIVEAENPDDDVFHVTGDNVKIIGFTIKNATNGAGIYLGGVNCMISSNNVTGNRYGIRIWYSHDNVISENIVSSNTYDGISLYNSENNVISNNTVSSNGRFGVHLDSSSNNEISSNTFVNDGLLVWYSYQNNVVSNTVNGKPLVYLENESDIIVENAGQVVLVKCNNITVEDLDLLDTDAGIELWSTNNSRITSNNILNNYHGIHMWYSSNNIISDNNISSNEIYGIFAKFESNNNTISNNTILDNEYGIELWGNSNNRILENDISNNWYGIELAGSDNNTISGNIVSSNKYMRNLHVRIRK